MFSMRVFAVLVLFAGCTSLLVQGQDPAARPRRTQAPPARFEANDRQQPSPGAVAEAKRLYKAGTKYGLAGLFKQAAANFEQAVKLNPNYVDAYFSLGHAYYDLREWDGAIKNLERGLALKPNDKQAIALLARARSMPPRSSSAGSTDAAGQTEDSHPSVRNVGRSSVPAAAPAEISLTNVYRVGPGDVVELRLGDSAPAPLTITPAGVLEHPDFSAPISSAGLTVEEITARIEEDLKRRGRNPSVTVSINEYVSHTILVGGLVKEPGPKVLKREAIPLFVVVTDAQPLPEADTVTVIRHDSNESFIADLSKPAEMKMLVRPRDVVTVQASPPQFIYVGGEVNSPGEKSFRRGLTLTQAVIAAGGLSKNSKEARVARDDGKGYLIVSKYKLKDIDSGKVPDPTLQAGDRITIVK